MKSLMEAWFVGGQACRVLFYISIKLSVYSKQYLTTTGNIESYFATGVSRRLENIGNVGCSGTISSIINVIDIFFPMAI